MSPQKEIKRIDSPPTTTRVKREKLKPRRERRQEERDRLRSKKVNFQKKAG